MSYEKELKIEMIFESFENYMGSEIMQIVVKKKKKNFDQNHKLEIQLTAGLT